MSDQSRRKLLKSIAAGSGAIVAGTSLPESWSRPVVDSVMLPAHAQTSGQTIYSSDNLTRAAFQDQKSDSMIAGLMNGLVSEAHAMPEPQESLPDKGCAMMVGENVDFWLQSFDGEVLEGEANGLLPLTGAEAPYYWIGPCERGNGEGQAKVVEANDNYIDIRFDGEGTWRFPAAGSCVSRTLEDCGT